MFNTDDFFKENPIEPETVFEHKKPINADKFSVDALLENSVSMLFVKARIENDYFSQGLYKVEWTKQLEKERDRLSNLPGRSEFDNSRLERINKKISVFRKWANSVDSKPTEKESHPSHDWQDNTTLTKLEKQHKAILEVIKQKRLSPMAIPDGDKGIIQQLCEHDYPSLFDKESSFETAWKKGRKLFMMANHASFARRSKK